MLGLARAGLLGPVALGCLLLGGCGARAGVAPVAAGPPAAVGNTTGALPSGVRTAGPARSAARSSVGYLTGTDLADAVGDLTYRPRPDGSVVVDPAWVADHIVTARVPILGEVTCHRLVVPRLRGAMADLVAHGWSHLVRPDDYGGCWVPRFVGHDPTRGLSLHTWGIAVDLDVSTNQRGTTGDIDRRVVAVMARWGFAWGGTWRDPDPMHFELAALVPVPAA